MPSDHLILCRPLLLPPSIFPSIGVFSNESALCIKWPKYWGFSFSISPSNEYSRLISFRMDLLAVQGTLVCDLFHSAVSSRSLMSFCVFFSGGLFASAFLHYLSRLSILSVIQFPYLLMSCPICSVISLLLCVCVHLYLNSFVNPWTV